MAAAKLTTIEAIVKVLGKSDEPMKVPALIAKVVPMTNLAGKAPGQTVYSVLYGEAKKPNSRVKQVAKGTFVLNPDYEKPAAKPKAAEPAASKPAKATASGKRNARPKKKSDEPTPVEPSAEIAVA